MRVLQVIPDIGVANGVMSVILNYAKAMPPDITFDVAYFAEKPQTRQAEVEALGGKVYRLDAPCPQDLCNGKMGRFFAEHAGVWEALHIHCPHFAVLLRRLPNEPGFIKSLCIATPLHILYPATAAEIGCSVYMPSIWCLRALRAAMRPAKCGTAIVPFGC